jgi:hypothetical protein
MAFADLAASEPEFRTILTLSMPALDDFACALYRFTFSLNLPEHLNVTTRRSDSIKSEPVAGLRPRRLPLFLTQNFGYHEHSRENAL